MSPRVGASLNFAPGCLWASPWSQPWSHACVSLCIFGCMRAHVLCMLVLTCDCVLTAVSGCCAWSEVGEGPSPSPARTHPHEATADWAWVSLLSTLSHAQTATPCHGEGPVSKCGALLCHKACGACGVSDSSPALSGSPYRP